MLLFKNSFLAKADKKKKKKKKRIEIHEGFREDSESMSYQENGTLCDQGPFKELELWYDKATFFILTTPKDLRFIEMPRHGEHQKQKKLN